MHLHITLDNYKQKKFLGSVLETYTNLPPLKADPFAAPNVDEATNMGITQAITPYKRSAKVWKKLTLLSEHSFTNNPTFEQNPRNKRADVKRASGRTRLHIWRENTVVASSRSLTTSASVMSAYNRALFKKLNSP